MVLDRHIFFSSKTAAHQLIFHIHLFRRNTEHFIAFSLGIIHPLIRGVNFHSIFFIWKSHCALRFQKCMFCPRSMKLFADHMPGIFNGFLCIPPAYVFSCQEVAVTVHEGRIVSHGFVRVLHRSEFFIFDPHQFFPLS